MSIINVFNVYRSVFRAPSKAAQARVANARDKAEKGLNSERPQTARQPSPERTITERPSTAKAKAEDDSSGKI